MRLFEFESKRIFKAEGIPVPRGEVVSSSEEAQRAAISLGMPVVLKAQVPVGGRGRAGAILTSREPEETPRLADELLHMRIGKFEVRKILVEECLLVASEVFLGITIEDSEGKLVVLAGSEGGMEIEEIASKFPEKIVSLKADSLSEFEQYKARQIARQIGFRGDLMLEVSNILWMLYELFLEYDATLAEINPLVITKTGEVLAAGAALTIDDEALFRHRELALDSEERIQDSIEKEAAKLGIAYLRLDGDIGVIGSGAGLAMATVDLVKECGGDPANFLDTGGRITRQHLRSCLDIVMKNPRVRAVLVNLYGGINPIVEAAHGIVEFLDERRLQLPVVVKLRGNFEEEAWGILERAGIRVVKATQTEEAARLIVALSRKEFS
jgi:succinyl-CoA synthetase beta subunit